MRLGQLARSLETTTTAIVDYLAESKIEIKDHPNVKLSDENEQMVIAAFGRPQAEEKPKPAKEETPLSETTQNELTEEDASATHSQEPEATNVESETELQEKETSIAEPSSEEKELESTEIVNEDSEPISEPEEEVEVIKAPKIELPGLKVVGKIDLPEPKPIAKEEPEEEADPEPEAETAPKVRYARHQRRNSRPKLTEEQREERRLRNKRAKEKRLREKAEREKLAEEKRLKDKKKQHYHQKLQNTSTKVNGRKKAKKPTPKLQQEPARPQPKTVLGKFWRWLNT